MNKLTWKRKNQLLLIGAVLLCVVVYKYAVSNTFDARATCNRLQLSLDSAAQAPQQLNRLKQEMQGFSARMISDTAISAHENLLGIISNYCSENRLVLRDFPPCVGFTQQDWFIENHPVVVEGSFVDLLQLVNHLEKNAPGHIISTEFKSRRDTKTQTLSLSLVIYIQTIQTKKS